MGDRIDPGSIRIAPLATRAHAQDLATWRYDPPYDVYDMAGADPDELLAPEVGFHAVLAGERLIGFRLVRGPTVRCPGGTTTTRHSTPAAACGRRSPGTAWVVPRSRPASTSAAPPSRRAAFRVTVAAVQHASAAAPSSRSASSGSATFEARRDGRPIRRPCVGDLLSASDGQCLRRAGVRRRGAARVQDPRPAPRPPSTRRGPGRAKCPSASTAQTGTPGKRSRTLLPRARRCPRGRSRTARRPRRPAREPTASSQVIRLDLVPATPSVGSPPARLTISGIQWPGRERAGRSTPAPAPGAAGQPGHATSYDGQPCPGDVQRCRGRGGTTGRAADPGHRRQHLLEVLGIDR